MERFAGAAGQAALVEDVGDLAGGVVVDGRDDVGRGFALLSNGFGCGEVSVV
ncbi:hypothetical protein [Rhodococcus opacus]|uniref:hypothetical protein n=1 Tax=Rhodococcus opacus TaxID=37919 RepID=UPI0029491043|nr:hypothetical protein [Rhodococcus opacus]MDV6247090.1 hypothetical protein [Rhodococcus opacus]